jgi:hypothetical protein
MTAPAHALSNQECGAKYQSAKAAGTLNGQNYRAFQKSQCSAEASPAAAAAPAAPAAPAPTTAAKKEAAPPPAPAPAPAATGNAVFPSAVNPKYATETPGKQRFKTCDDQYNANKATGGNGGLKWIQKGGGYYSECNKRLKGPA